jgi:hypothetical protein
VSWRYFLGAAILASGVLIKVGAPLAAVAAGVALAAFINWRTEHRARK